MKIFLLFLIGLFSFSAFGQKSTVSGVTVYHDPQFSFSISYSKIWLLQEATDQESRLDILLDNANEFASVNLRVTQYNGSEALSSKDYVSLMLDKNYALLQQTAKKSLVNGKLVSSGRTTLGGQDAYYVLIEGSAGSDEDTIDLKTYSIQMVTGRNIYTLTCGAGTESFDKYYPQFQAIASSFKFDPVKKN